jgi:hypothetical protein
MANGDEPIYDLGVLENCITHGCDLPCGRDTVTFGLGLLNCFGTDEATADFRADFIDIAAAGGRVPKWAGHIDHSLPDSKEGRIVVLFSSMPGDVLPDATELPFRYGQEICTTLAAV